MKKVSTKINEYKEHLKRLHDYQGAPDFQILKWFSQDYSGMNIKYIETIAINNVFDPINEVEDIDEDGFTTITANNASKNRHISSKGLSFSVIKDDDSEDSIIKEINENKLLNKKKQRNKLSRGGVFKTKFNDNDNDEEYNNEENEGFDFSMKKDQGFYDIHNKAKQKRKYNELKALFDLDKKLISNNN